MINFRKIKHLDGIWGDLKINFGSTPIQATNRTLKSSFTLSAMRDIQAMHNTDLSIEMVDIEGSSVSKVMEQWINHESE